jgi:hypothetical protein
MPGYNQPRDSEMIAEVTADVEAGREPHEHVVKLISVLIDGQIEVVNGLMGNQAEQLEAAIIESQNLD